MREFQLHSMLYTQLYHQLHKTCSIHTVEYSNVLVKSTYIRVLSSVQLGQSRDVRVKWRAKLERSTSVSSISKGCNLHVRQNTTNADYWPNQNVSNTSWNPEVHFRGHKIFQMASFRIQFIPLHRLAVYFHLILSYHLKLFNEYRGHFSRR